MWSVNFPDFFSVLNFWRFFTICPTVRMVVVDFLRVTTLNCSIVKAPKEQWQSIDVSSLIQRNFLSWVQVVLPLFKTISFQIIKPKYLASSRFALSLLLQTGYFDNVLKKSPNTGNFFGLITNFLKSLKNIKTGLVKEIWGQTI